MAITDKNRKTLWARSGNRCAMCRTELVVERNEHDRNLNIGDECHIISEQPNGPRHISKYDKDFDDYENLILLCKNHHKTIDELWETYTIELLKTIKVNHENWIKTVIDNAKQKDKADKPRLLPRLTNGKQIVDIILEVAAYQFDHCELSSQDDADFIAGFYQDIQDWGEASVFGGFEIGRQIQLGFELKKEIEELENRGFFLFGERRRTRMFTDDKKDLGIWDIAVLVILRNNDPVIINNSEILVKIKM